MKKVYFAERTINSNGTFPPYGTEIEITPMLEEENRFTGNLPNGYAATFEFDETVAGNGWWCRCNGFLCRIHIEDLNEA